MNPWSKMLTKIKVFFSGKSTIDFEYNTDSSYIVLNAGYNEGFTVTGVTLSGGIEVAEWEHYKEKELLIVEKKNDHEIGKRLGIRKPRFNFLWTELLVYPIFG